LQTLSAQAVLPLPQPVYHGHMYNTPTPPPAMFVYATPTPSPLPQYQQVEVPANMQVFGAVHGQVFPVLKNEEAPVSNASSESGLKSLTPPPAPAKEEPPKQQALPSGKRSPPGFDKPIIQPRRAKRPQVKKSETINYARAAKARLQPTFKQTRRTSAPAKAEKISRVKREIIRPKQPTPKPAVIQHRRPKKKFGFRSKQNMIDKVYDALTQKYQDLGILAGSDEVLRGDDTIRLHVKKFKALKRIQEALAAVERSPFIKISKVSTPLSMKNQFQKKGFLVYVRVADVSMVDEAKRIFQQFEEFKKCEVARQTTPSNSFAKNEGPQTIVEEPASVDKVAAPAKEINPWINVDGDSFSKEGHVEETGHGEPEADPYIGAVEDCGVSFEGPETGSPEFTYSDKLFEDDGDCGVLELDLTALPMMHKISIGEAG